MATKQEFIQRWDAFLQKIEARFNESLQHAEEACVEQLIATDYDYFTTMRTWMGIRAQIDQLTKKIDETWSTKVQPQMEALADDYWYHDEMLKQHDVNEKLVYQLEDFQIQLEGKLSKLFYDHAIQIANKDFNCSQCNASIDIVKDLFRAQYITCNYCQTVNTFEPETKYVQVGWGIIDNIVALELLPLKQQMNSAFEKIQELRHPVTDKVLEEQLWQTYKQKYFNYYETYFKRCIEFNSDKEKRFEEDIKRKELEFNEQEAVQRYNKYSKTN